MAGPLGFSAVEQFQYEKSIRCGYVELESLSYTNLSIRVISHRPASTSSFAKLVSHCTHFQSSPRHTITCHALIGDSQVAIYIYICSLDPTTPICNHLMLGLHRQLLTCQRRESNVIPCCYSQSIG